MTFFETIKKEDHYEAEIIIGKEVQKSMKKKVKYIFMVFKKNSIKIFFFCLIKGGCWFESSHNHSYSHIVRKLTKDDHPGTSRDCTDFPVMSMSVRSIILD